MAPFQSPCSTLVHYLSPMRFRSQPGTMHVLIPSYCALRIGREKQTAWPHGLHVMPTLYVSGYGCT